VDFSYPPEAEAFRQELRTWLDANLDDASRAARLDEGDPGERLEVLRRWNRTLADAGYAAVSWPSEYGGRDAGVMEQVVFSEEMHRAGAPGTVNPIGIANIAPSIMSWGTQEQKSRFLQRMLRGDDIWCQGFSEPGAGSDLASLRTRAVLDGDHYVVDGQKVWNTFGDIANYCELLVRTDPDAPKHRGITCLLVDMKQPGITVRPLYDGLGRWRWSEIFLEDVRVPKRNLIGELNRGFYTAMTTLSFERSQVEIPARLMLFMEQFVEAAKVRKRLGGHDLLADPIARNVIADLRVQVETTRMLCYRVAWMQSQGLVPDKEASMVKLMGDEVGFTVYNRLAKLMEDDAMIVPRTSRRAPIGGFMGVNAWLIRGLAIGGGTDEVQRNIIAQRGLDLPR